MDTNRNGKGKEKERGTYNVNGVVDLLMRPELALDVLVAE